MLKRLALLTLAACALAGNARAEEVRFVADGAADAVKKEKIDGSEIIMTRGRVQGLAAFRIVTPARPRGVYFAAAGAASRRAAARALCQALAPKGSWDLPDRGGAFFGLITVGGSFGPEHVSHRVVLDEETPGRRARGAYLVWVRGTNEGEETRLLGTDKLFAFTDGNGGADDRYISLSAHRVQLKRALDAAATLPADQRGQPEERALARFYDGIKGDVPVFCVSGLE